MSRALLRYLAHSFVATQRYAAPVVVLVLVLAGVLAAPPLDASSALLVAIAQLACSMWLAYLAAGMEDPAQEAVTATRAGSRRGPWLGKLLVAGATALAVPAIGVGLAAATGRLAAGTGVAWAVAVLAPTAAGIGVGSLVHSLLRARPGHATLAILTLTALDLAAPWVPPLGSFGHLPDDGAAATALLVTTAGGAAIGAAALAASGWIDARR